MTEELHKLTITRSNWVNGSNCGVTINGGKGCVSLLNKHGNMCCLGFLAKTCGLKPNDILDFADPLDLWALNHMSWQDH